MSNQDSESALSIRSPSPRDGYLLLGATAFEVLAMAHHPSVHTHDTALAVEQISHLASISGWVHGLLIALFLISSFALVQFSDRRGFNKRTIRAAIIAYAVGIFAILIAAMMSGFVITQVAALTPHVTEVDLAINQQLLILCRILNQSFASLGVLAMSVAMLFWSLDLIESPGLPRVLGIAGCAIAILPVAGLGLGLFYLNVSGAMIVLLFQSVWNAGIGGLLIAEKV